MTGETVIKGREVGSGGWMEVARRPEKCEIVEICFTVRGADVAVMNLQPPTRVSEGSPPSSALLSPLRPHT